MIKAIHILTVQKIEELIRESDEIEDESFKISLDSQDPRDAITCVLTHICNEVEPKLKEAVCFVAAKECLRLIIENSTTENSSIKNITSNNVISSEKSNVLLLGETDPKIVNNLMSKNDVEIKHVAYKDTTYYLLWILEEVLVNNQESQLDHEILSGRNLLYINIFIRLL